MTSKNRLPIVATIGLCAVTSASSVAACGDSTACTVESGEYFIALPDEQEGLLPAFVFIHGFGGTGQGVMRNERLKDAVLSRGYAFVAPAGLMMEGRGGASWSFHPERPPRRDEIAFLTEVKNDLTKNQGVDPDRIVLGGFSIGGSMTSYVACAAPETFTAYTPLGGSFWRPHPEACAGPVRLLHTHGWSDGTVPLEGRRVGSGFVQGDVFHAMSIWRETNGCDALKADRFSGASGYWHRIWDACDDNSALQLSIFPGGHVIPRGWVDMALDWYEAL